MTNKASLMNHNQETCFTRLYTELHRIVLRHEQLEILKSDFSLSLGNWMTLNKSLKLSIPLSANIHSSYTFKFQKHYE